MANPRGRYLVFLFGTQVEADWIARLMRLERVATRTDLVRRALWTLADEHGLDPPPGCFDGRTHGPKRRRTP